MTIIDESLAIPVADGSTLPGYSARPAAQLHRVGVIVAHELFGVNPDIRGVVDRVAGQGFFAFAPEFYHRDAPAGRWLHRDDAGRQLGFALLHRMSRAGALADVRAAMNHVLAQPDIDEVAMIGFSAGGHLAYLAASQLPIGRTVVLYGGWLPTTDIPLSRPEPTLALTPQITGRVLYLVGSADALIDDAQREQIREALDSAGVDHQLVGYPGVQHAYFWPGIPGFDEAATRDSWDRILTFLGKGLSARPAGR